MNTEPVHTKARYFLSIDGLRFFASMNIILFHLEYIGGFNDMGGSPGWFFRIIKGPTFHATFFFLLGGFIFTTKFFPVFEQFNTRHFLLKRFKELYPLHFTTTLLMAVLFIVRESTTGSLDFPRLVFSLFLHLSFLWPFFPFNTFTLNTPSWALAAFFFCYLFFGILLRILNKLRNRRDVLIFSGILFFPSILWSFLYAVTGAPNWLYQFFHAFPLLRAVEFFLGMLLARFFMLTSDKKSLNNTIAGTFSDISFIILSILIYETLRIQNNLSPSGHFFTYHSVMLLFYVCIVYLLASEKGILSRFFAIKFVRDMGRSSFYPYLLHIPYFSCITFIAERYFNNYKFLHKPQNVWICIFILYMGSYLYVNKFKKKTNTTNRNSFLNVSIIKSESV